MKRLIALTFSLFLLAFDVAAADPTRPPSAAEIEAWLRGETVAQAEAEVVYQLQSVLLSDQRRIAVINGQHLTIGDAIDGARVDTIEAGRVVLEYNGESLPL